MGNRAATRSLGDGLPREASWHAHMEPSGVRMIIGALGVRCGASSSRTGNGLVAHSNVLLMYHRWLIDRATSLTFSGH
jgi:hypothetical protein